MASPRNISLPAFKRCSNARASRRFHTMRAVPSITRKTKATVQAEYSSLRDVVTKFFLRRELTRKYRCPRAGRQESDARDSQTRALTSSSVRQQHKCHVGKYRDFRERRRPQQLLRRHRHELHLFQIAGVGFAL